MLHHRFFVVSCYMFDFSAGSLMSSITESVVFPNFRFYFTLIFVFFLLLDIGSGGAEICKSFYESGK